MRAVRLLPLVLTSAVWAGASACGGDGGSAVDAGNVIADAGADATPPGPYDSPEDFDRARCVTPPALDGVDLTGVWHMDMSLPGYGKLAGVFRLFDDEQPYRARLFGAPQNWVRATVTDVFMRRAWTSAEGYARVHALDLCRINDDGSLSGQFVTCRDGDCTEGPIDAYRVDDVTEPTSVNMTLIAEYAGGATPWPTDSAITANVRVKDNRAYLVRFGDGLRIVDVSTPAAPADLGHSPVAVAGSEIYNDVKLVEDQSGTTFALVASDVRGAVAIDVSNPANPVEVSTFPQPPLGENRVKVHTIFVEGTRAYLANTGDGGIEIWDVADPRSPQKLGQYIAPGAALAGAFVHDLFVENNIAYLNYWRLGMVILDASDPASPVVLGTFDSYDRRKSHSNWVTTAGGRKISVHGDEDFDAHVRIVDVDPNSVAFVNEIGSFQTRKQVSVHNIMAVGELAFVTYYQDGFRVLDLSDPTQPTEIAHYRTWPGSSGLAPGYGDNFFEGAIGVEYDAVSGLIYVADTHRGLFILHLDAP